MRGVHLGYIAGPRTVLYSCSRRHLRHVLPRPVRRERPVARLHGLEDALVLGTGLARHALGWTPGGHDAHRLLPATRIQCLRDVLDDAARRRGDGQQLCFTRHDGLRAAGDVGGLADRLATTVERRARLPYRWTSHRPVVSPEGRVFGRPGNRQALNRAYHVFDLPPKAATRSATTSRWRGRACTISVEAFCVARASRSPDQLDCTLSGAAPARE